MSPHDSRSTGVLERAWTALADGHAVALGKALAILDVRSTSATRRVDREGAREARDALDRARGRVEAAFGRLLRLHAGDAAVTSAATPRATRPLDWDALTLVDDDAVEKDIAVARLAQQIGAAAEAEFREIAAHLGALCGHDHLDVERVPLRAQVVARAMHDALVEGLPERTVREPVLSEVATAMLAALPGVLGAILGDLQAQGVRKLGLRIRATDWTALGPAPTDFGDDGPTTGQGQHGHGPGHPGSGHHAQASRGGGGAPTAWRNSGARGTGPSGFGPSSGSGAASDDPRPSTPVDQGQAFTALLRRLNAMVDEATAVGDAGPANSGWSPSRAAAGPTTWGGDRYRGGPSGPGPAAASGRGDATTTDGGQAGLVTALLPNLIRMHQGELQRAAGGTLDHLVIEVVGSLFDQVLADGRVPPQMARQIARLQLPVLRVTLHDPGFFVSRRHPVRQFINRLASLACAFEDLTDGPGRVLLQRVMALVQEIIDGDFEQVELYARQLRELERFVEDASSQALELQSRAPSLLVQKEAQLRVQLRYRAQLQRALEPLRLPGFLHDFLSQVWSQALVDARRDAPADPGRLDRWRGVARDLVSSVQPKGEPSQRKRFLMLLPGLMRELQAGLQHIGWPLQAQQTFLAQLKVAQADALRGPPLSELDHNLLVKQVEAVFAAPLPVGPDAPPLATPLPDVPDATAGTAVFSDTEAQQLGWVPEQTLPIAGPVRAPQPVAAEGQPVAETLRLDLDFEAWGEAVPDTPEPVADTPATPTVPDPLVPVARAAGLDIDLDAAGPAAPEPSRGPGLADHLRIGYAYEMLLKTRWKKVRLSHVSPGRTFFVFTHGHRHQETLTMTARMVRHVCATGRMRAVESDWLIERASERARRQLAEIGRTPQPAPAAVD